MKFAERLQNELTGVEEAVVLYPVKGALLPLVYHCQDADVLAGGSSMVSIISGCSSIVNNVFLKFLNRLPPARSDLQPPLMAIEDRMRAALNTLAGVTGRDITNLDPMSSISFSCLSQEAIKIQTLVMKQFQAELSEAFTPDPAEGRAMR